MQVSELIAMLQLMPQDADVHIKYPSGNYWGTYKAPVIDEVDLGNVVYSNQYQTEILLDEDDTENRKNVREVVIIG